jgi:hypothetical protein
MRMRTVALAGVVIVGLAVVVVCAAILLMMPRGPRFEDVKYLLEPRIATLPDQRVVVVEAKGDPNVLGGEAFTLLFKTYFSLKGVPKGPKQPAPRARWPLSLNTPKEQWVGQYAMPVPDAVQSLGDTATSPSGLQARLATWEYGDVAEILHVGPYSHEEPTIRQLLDFIKGKGYATKGEHEEEYLRGPGMFGRGDPRKYLTIIRYRVRKAE